MLVVVALLLGVTAAAAPRHDDDTLAAVDGAFSILRDDRPAALSRARARLEAAAPALGDLDPDISDAARAFAGDRRRPWRGQAHERALAFLTLAALDAHAGRCDLAVPATKSAEHHLGQAHLHSGDRGRAERRLPLAAALRLRCQAGDDDDRAAVGRALAVHLQSGGGVRLEFRGRAPTLVAHGAHGEGLARARIDDDDVAFTLTLPPRMAQGGGASTTAKASPMTGFDVDVDAAPLGPAAMAQRAARAAQKQALASDAQRAVARAQAPAAGTRGFVGGALLMTAAAGLSATSATIDAAADTRTATSMPARVQILPM